MPDLPLMLNWSSGQQPYPCQPWALENGCFSAKWNSERWLAAMLHLQPLQATCWFVVAPDVYADADATWRRSEPWLDPIRQFGYRVALVAQNGLEAWSDIPWSRFDCLFVGGTTEWKLSYQAHRLIRMAKDAGKWVHVGRVNSRRRLWVFAAAGADSADGTILAFDPKCPVRDWQDELDRWY